MYILLPIIIIITHARTPDGAAPTSCIVEKERKGAPTVTAANALGYLYGKATEGAKTTPAAMETSARNITDETPKQLKHQLQV